MVRLVQRHASQSPHLNTDRRRGIRDGAGGKNLSTSGLRGKSGRDIDRRAEDIAAPFDDRSVVQPGP